MNKEKIEKLVDEYNNLVEHCENRCDAICKAYGRDHRYITGGNHYFDNNGFLLEYVNTYDYYSREGQQSLTWKEISMSNEEFEKVLIAIREAVEKRKKEKEKMTEDVQLAVKLAQYEKLKQELKEKGKI